MSLSDDIGLPGDSPTTGSGSVASVAASTGPSVPRDAGERSGPGEGLVLLLWAVAVLAAVVFVLTRAESDELHDPVKKAARGEVTGLGPLSLLQPTRFAGAMNAITEKYPDARALSIRVEPTRVNATLRTGEYVAQRVSVDVGLTASQDGEGETTENGLAMSRVDPAAPERLVRAVNGRTHTQPTDVDYLVLITSSSSDPRWALFLARGTPPDQRNYTSDLSGHHVKANF